MLREASSNEYQEGQLTLTIREYFSELLVHGLALTNSQMDVSCTPVTLNAWSSLQAAAAQTFAQTKHICGH